MGLIGSFLGGAAPGMMEVGKQMADYSSRSTLMKEEAAIRAEAEARLHERGRGEQQADYETKKADEISAEGRRVKNEISIRNKTRDPLDVEASQFTLDTAQKNEGYKQGLINAEAVMAQSAPDTPEYNKAAKDAEIYKKAMNAGGKEGGAFHTNVVDDEEGRKTLAVTDYKGNTTWRKPGDNQQAQTFATPAEVQAAKSAGKIKSGDIINTPNGQIRVK